MRTHKGPLGLGDSLLVLGHEAQKVGQNAREKQTKDARRGEGEQKTTISKDYR